MKSCFFEQLQELSLTFAAHQIAASPIRVDDDIRRHSIHAVLQRSSYIHIPIQIHRSHRPPQLLLHLQAGEHLAIHFHTERATVARKMDQQRPPVFGGLLLSISQSSMPDRLLPLSSQTMHTEHQYQQQHICSDHDDFPPCTTA